MMIGSMLRSRRAGYGPTVSVGCTSALERIAD